MPEAFAVLAVFAIIAAVYVGALLQARNSTAHHSRHDLDRLQHQVIWLQERLEVAQRENWEQGMIATLRGELDATAQQLAQASAMSVN